MATWSSSLSGAPSVAYSLSTNDRELEARSEQCSNPSCVIPRLAQPIFIPRRLPPETAFFPLEPHSSWTRRPPYQPPQNSARAQATRQTRRVKAYRRTNLAPLNHETRSPVSKSRCAAIISGFWHQQDIIVVLKLHTRFNCYYSYKRIHAQ